MHLDQTNSHSVRLPVSRVAPGTANLNPEAEAASSNRKLVSAAPAARRQPGGTRRGKARLGPAQAVSSAGSALSALSAWQAWHHWHTAPLAPPTACPGPRPALALPTPLPEAMRRAVAVATPRTKGYAAGLRYLHYGFILGCSSLHVRVLCRERDLDLDRERERDNE